MATKTKSITVEEKLALLFELQQVDSSIDTINRLKGELPMEVADLNDEIEGLAARIDRLTEEISEFEQAISDKRNQKKESESLIEKYTKQQSSVKNNREFDALTKEIELQNLEIQIADKRIREAHEQIEHSKESLEKTQALIESRKEDLAAKNVDLDKIIKQTEKDEKKLAKDREKVEGKLNERLHKAYERIRGKYKNGLAVVTVERDACGGCYSSIPPQIQLEINSMKRVIQCENCARVLVPSDFVDDQE